MQQSPRTTSGAQSAQWSASVSARPLGHPTEESSPGHDSADMLSTARMQQDAPPAYAWGWELGHCHPDTGAQVMVPRKSGWPSRDWSVHSPFMCLPSVLSGLERESC
jgi:hypothetical protein